MPVLRGLRLNVGEVWRRWRSDRAARKLKAAIRIARIDAAIAELKPIIETTKGDEHHG